MESVLLLNSNRYLIAPDTAHFLYLSMLSIILNDFLIKTYIEQFIEAFPKAKVVGVDGVQHKTDVKFDYIFGQEPSDKPVGYEPEVGTL